MPGESLDDLVGAERAVAVQHRFEHVAAHRSEPLRAGGALRFGMRNGGAGAAAVVVIRGWEYRAGHIFLRLNHLTDPPWQWDTGTLADRDGIAKR